MMSYAMNIRAPIMLGSGDQTVNGWPDQFHDYSPRFLLSNNGAAYGALVP
jgi:hypothetical protein